jgi:hypothetical protein
MSQNFSNLITNNSDDSTGSIVNAANRNWWMLPVLPAWVAVCFFVVQILIGNLVSLMVLVNIPLKSINSAVLESILAMIIYVFTIFLVITVPWLIEKNRTTKSEIGLTRLLLGI